jgi:hypothetical protein
VQYLLLGFTIFNVLEGPIHGGNELETPNCKQGTIIHAETSVSTDIFAGAIISVVQYLAPVRYPFDRSVAILRRNPSQCVLLAAFHGNLTKRCPPFKASERKFHKCCFQAQLHRPNVDVPVMCISRCSRLIVELSHYNKMHARPLQGTIAKATSHPCWNIRCILAQKS